MAGLRRFSSCPTSDLPGPSFAPLPRDDAGRQSTGSTVSPGGGEGATSFSASARAQRSGANQFSRTAHCTWADGSTSGSAAATTSAVSCQSSLGESSATGTGCGFYFFVPPGGGRDQLASRTSHSTHGGDPQGVGRQSNPNWSAHSEYRAQLFADLPTAAPF